MTARAAAADKGAALGAVADEVTRVRLGAGPATPPDILLALAADPSVTVRAAVATNGASPVQAAHLLAADDDERVRALVARKLAALAPGLSAGEQEGLSQRTYRALLGLVSDEAERVRAAVAEIVREMPDAPRDLILALARDPVVTISEPVITLSPMLTEQDLLELLIAPPNRSTVASVARRPGLSEAVADAIAATADVAAIGALLRNPTAAIREATLDALISEAAERIEWHVPLTQRPRLTGRLAQRIADIVETSLLRQMADRADLDPAVAADLTNRLRARLHAEAGRRIADLGATFGAGAPPGVGAVPVDVDHALRTARSWTERATPSPEALILEAIRRGDERITALLLARAAEVDLAVVERAVALHSAKGIVSLAWKARYAARTAVLLQALLGGISPPALLRPKQGGEYPLTEDEMRWQIAFLSRSRGTPSLLGPRTEITAGSAFRPPSR